MTHADLETYSGEGGMDEIDIAVQANAVGAGDDIKVSHILFFQGGFRDMAVCVCFCWVII